MFAFARRKKFFSLSNDTPCIISSPLFLDLFHSYLNRLFSLLLHLFYAAKSKVRSFFRPFSFKLPSERWKKAKQKSFPFYIPTIRFEAEMKRKKVGKEVNVIDTHTRKSPNRNVIVTFSFLNRIFTYRVQVESSVQSVHHYGQCRSHSFHCDV